MKTIEISNIDFKKNFKRLLRQLNERSIKVKNKQKPDKYYQNKRQEFIKLIDSVIEDGWFTMPPKSTRIWKIYYDVWN